MAVLVVLLRGVNVGGRSALSMAKLRGVAEDLGYGDVRTYIQSGNLLLSTTKKPATVARELERAIARECGVDTDAIVRTKAELAKAVDANPYVARGEDEEHLHVVFCAQWATTGIDDLDRYAPEEATANGRELYLFLPSGMGRSKLAADLARRGGRGTARSWRTVTKVLQLADGPT